MASIPFPVEGIPSNVTSLFFDDQHHQQQTSSPSLSSSSSSSSPQPSTSSSSSSFQQWEQCESSGGDSNNDIFTSISSGSPAAATSSSLRLHDILQDRRNTNDFKWASRPVTPPKYFVRNGNGVNKCKEGKDLFPLVLSSRRVRAVIRQISEDEGVDEVEIVGRAHEILSQMGHDFHLYTIRWFGYVLSKLSKGHFSSIFVNMEKLEEIRACCQQYPVLLLPTHRSYVDFLLLSYVCFSFDLPLPVIAAGMDFMGMMGIAELLRKAGAFFIRRRFGDDRLYRTLIDEYVKHSVLSSGHPLEMFIEGTRSRSGKTLYPKVGLLTSIAELVRERQVPDVLILPVSMSYDRTLEESLYARELLGQPKPKESTQGLVKGLRWLGSQSYGAMYVNFGSFISVREVLGEFGEGSCYLDDGVFGRRVEKIAMEALFEQQKGLLCPIFSAVAVVMLGEIASGHRSIEFQKLVTQVTTFRNLLSLKGMDFGFPLRGETLEWNIRHILSVHESVVVCPKFEEHVVHIKMDGGEDEAVTGMKFQHYSNQILPFILPHCLVALITAASTSERGGVEALSGMDEYLFLRELLFDDFIYRKGTEVEEFMSANETDIFSRVDKSKDGDGHTLNLAIRKILKTAVEPFVIAYWGLAKTLDEVNTRSPTPSPIEVKQLTKMTQGYIRQFLGSDFPLHYGSLSLDTLNNAAMALIKLKYAEKVKIASNLASFALLVREKDRSMLKRLIEQLGKYLPYKTSSTKDLVKEDFSQMLQLKAKL